MKDIVIHVENGECEIEDAHLFPIVRRRSYLGDVPYNFIGDNLGIAIVYDNDGTMSLIESRVLNQWGVTFDQAIETARTNLTLLPHRFIRSHNGLYVSDMEDNYDSSLLLALETIRQLPLAGEVIAMVPNRDKLLVAGSDDVDGLTEMLAKTQDSISDGALRLDGDNWVPWMPDRGHPLYVRFQELCFGARYEGYLPHEEQFADVYVAPYLRHQVENAREMISYSLWVKGLPTLLPRTDLIFFPKGREGFVAPWEQVVDVMGHLMVPVPNLHPERYKVTAFPTQGQLREMGAIHMRALRAALKILKEGRIKVACPDCGVLIGEPHSDDCDVQICSACGRQKIQCDCPDHDPHKSRWMGVWPTPTKRTCDETDKS